MFLHVLAVNLPKLMKNEQKQNLFHLFIDQHLGNENQENSFIDCVGLLAGGWVTSLEGERIPPFCTL